MLNFSEWDKKYYSIDESAEETVLNWLSRTFGGKVKKMASGGSSASKRADGIATKGKTRGKMC